MKLSSAVIGFVSSTSAVLSPDCFAKDVDIDGNTFRTNVVTDVRNVYQPADCQRHCQAWASRGCEFFVWEEMTSKCVLYRNLKQIEFDDDPKQKTMGPVTGCFPCFRHHWDYVQTGSGKNM